MRKRLPMIVSTLLALALAVVSAPLLALGLGQIEVVSRSGEPLVAEIPIISSDPAELSQLQARLASPDTFRRIGLEPPRGAVSNLQFAVALDARGNPVVRVTSAAPIDQPLLTFLLEVDWGQGRLVREYSVLVDAPDSATAIAQPPIQAPLPPPSSTVVRPVESVQPVTTVPDVESEALPAEPVQADVEQAPPAPAQPDPQPQPVAPQPAVAATPPPAAPATPEAYGPVERGQTLSGIASGMGLADYSLNQAMLALLRSNPEAFIDGNINLLREGAVLRVPGRDVMAELSPSEADAVVQAQVRSWRERQAPAAVAVEGATEGSRATPARSDDASAPAGTADTSAADARLEIVPPAGADGQAPGSRSGTSAGGEGDMLRNELRQAKEDLATRDAEVEELRGRLAEVEELQRKQAQLLDLKDSELASVQQRLAESRAGDGAAATSAPESREATMAQPEADAPMSALPWLLGGLLLLVAAAAAWWWQHRRPATPVVLGPPTPRRSYDTAAMAAGLGQAGRVDPTVKSAAPAGAPSAPAGGAVPPGTVRAPAQAPPPAPPVSTPAPTQAATATATPAPASTPPAGAPAGTLDAPAQMAPAEAAGPAKASPTWHAGAVPLVADADAPAVPGVAASGLAVGAAGRDSLELARAYLDLGDHQAARTLLREVLLGRDPGAREEAARMLRELG